MSADQYLNELSEQLAYLFEFSRQMSELDFAGALSGEFRGAQDAGWATTITAQEVHKEIVDLLNSGKPLDKRELRIALMLYCQLSEAGGVYETLKNLMGIVKREPYLLWPFKDLVKVKLAPKRIIGPNANTTFRDLASNAKDIGMQRLSELLEIAFHDDIRNGITHADYVIWNDGLRLRKRNGGFADCITFEDVSMVLGKGIGFFELLGEYLSESVKSFSPPKTIVGRFSANPPMTWTVTYDPETGSFEIGGSSPGPQTTPEYLRQEAINKHLGGKVSSIYFVEHTEGVRVVCNHIADRGFKPHEIRMADQQLEELVVSINKENLWQVGASPKDEADMLLLTPKGYRWLREVADFDHYLGKPVLSMEFAGPLEEESSGE